MIVKASQRSGAKQLGLHLLKTEENEHVEVHEVRGFVADDLMGAMKEAYAVSAGTKCRKHLFSVSLNPPADQAVQVEVFEKACDTIEERLGLKGQPRVIVFHEKEGRRHAHAVWSRIDTEKMTAKPLPYFKQALNAVAKQLYLENGWQMPDGFRDWRLKDPRNFTLDEWQQAKQANIDPREVRGAVEQAWAISDNGYAFAKALEDRGLFLAKGDRNGHVAVTIDGGIFAVTRMVGARQKEVTAKLGDPMKLRDVAGTMRHIGKTVAPRLSRYISEAKRIAHNAMKPLNERKAVMNAQHQRERKVLADKQRERHIAEQAERSGRLRKGVAGAWDILTGRYFKVRKQNEMEAYFGVQRDRAQRHNLIAAQMKDRQSLQQDIVQMRERSARQMLGLYQSAAHYRAAARDNRGQSRGPELGG